MNFHKTGVSGYGLLMSDILVREAFIIKINKIDFQGFGEGSWVQFLHFLRYFFNHKGRQLRWSQSLILFYYSSPYHLNKGQMSTLWRVFIADVLALSLLTCIKTMQEMFWICFDIFQAVKVSFWQISTFWMWWSSNMCRIWYGSSIWIDLEDETNCTNQPTNCHSLF